MSSRGPNPTRRVERGKYHDYYLDGEKLVGRGVTTIIGAGYPKKALQYWAARQVAMAAVQQRDLWEPLAADNEDSAIDWLREAPTRSVTTAAKRGTDVHRLAEALHLEEEVDVPEHLRGHVDQYLDWWETWWPRETIVEGVVLNRTQRYMGTFDLVATFDGWNPDGSSARVLVDLKTSAGGVYPDVCLQLAAYRYAEAYLEDPTGGTEVPMPAVDACAVLHVTEDQWSFVVIDAGPREYRAFQYVDETARMIGTSKTQPGWAESVIGRKMTNPNPTF